MKKPGYTRYFCTRCNRPLENDPSLKHNPADTVTPRLGMETWTHDTCGGDVLLAVDAKRAK